MGSASCGGALAPGAVAPMRPGRREGPMCLRACSLVTNPVRPRPHAGPTPARAYMLTSGSTMRCGLAMHFCLMLCANILGVMRLLLST